MSNDRRQSAYDFRVAAAEKARSRTHPEHRANPDEARYGAACYPMSFTKGLEHDVGTGLVGRAADFEAFRTAIDNGFAEPFTTHVPVPRSDEFGRRVWEAPTAGTVYELEGPDPQAVTMAPAPALCSDELTFEMAEVYELALVRDVSFESFEAGGPASAALSDAVTRLNDLSYASGGFDGRPRKTDAAGQLDVQTAFRGSSPGVDQGPYVSQFLMIGTSGDPADGVIGYGAQTIDQRVLHASEKDDYMMKWADWMTVQNGYEPRAKGEPGQAFDGTTRLICTPRDLATYVHVDQLYQAYLNACLILLGQGAPFDPGFGLLSGRGEGVLEGPKSQDYVGYNAGGFALWGGPHILSLVTEVATRGLKAVRFQKFNNHLRLRPEALAGRMEKAVEIDAAHPVLCGAFTKMREQLEATLAAILTYNTDAHGASTVLLPMAFKEGSPMHPTYGAGHATVAGACVTMLKAFFDTSAIFVKLVEKSKGKDPKISAAFWNKDQIKKALIHNAKKKDSKLKIFAGSYVAACEKGYKDQLTFRPCGEFGLKGGKCHEELVYKKTSDCCPLTLEGELNKLAANISIGRNMAGVHYFSDYYDSARMGEEIAIGILEEQAIGYQTDRFVMSLPTFDGKTVRIGRA